MCFELKYVKHNFGFRMGCLESNLQLTLSEFEMKYIDIQNR